MSIFYKALCLVFPERCPYCGEIVDSESIACADCQKKIDKYRQPIIRGTHGYRCVSTFFYGNRVRRMILRIKYRDRIQFLSQVAKIMTKDIKAVYPDDEFDYVTSVPMHKKDFEHRGYNQAQLLAIEIAKLLNTPYEETLVKVKRTKKQHKLSYKERKTNLKGSFKCIDKEQISGKNSLIIDDIVTSGETLGECCKVLSRSKPRLVCCATIATAHHAVNKRAII